MANSRKRDAGDDHPNEGEDVSDSSSTIDSRSNDAAGSERVSSNPLTDQGGRDFFLGEDMVLRWLQALDMQVVGACRGDERLKPLLKLNVSNGMAEDRLLAHLSQHFEPAEIGMLARCFCIPLVSLRVGKINKEGTIMRPIPIRGNLSLMVLPTSDLRLSFTGDNGHSEQLFTYTRKSQCTSVSIEQITADSSGRSFVIRIADGNAFYYWCSEKSKLLGIELCRKMIELIKKKPSVSELTGIEESRLGSVASHLRLYLMGSVVPNIKGCPVPTLDSSSSPGSSETTASSSSSTSSKSLRARHSGTQLSKAEGSLSPRSSSFKENTLINSSLRISFRDKSKLRSEDHFSIYDSLPITSIPTNVDGFIQSGGEAAEDNNRNGLLIALEAAELASSTMTLPPHFPLKIGPPVFSPYYCWCPPTTSSLHAPSASYQFPPLSIELPLLPPLSSLLPSSRSDGFLIPSSPLDLSELPPLPLVSSSSSSQQMMIPIMCDPIVHIPVMDICSSGQSYLVSAGPTGMIPTSIPPLPVENDSLVEKGARETLRLLISGANATTSNPMNLHGSRGLYSGSRDVSGVSLFAPIGLQQQPSAGEGGDGGEKVSSSEAVKHCRKIKTLLMEESTFLEKDGNWLHELALHNTSLEVLNFYMTEFTKISPIDLETIARNCHRSLVSVKVGDFEIFELAGFFKAAAKLEEFCGGSLNEDIGRPEKYMNLTFPPKLCRVGLSYMGPNEMPILFPFAAQIRKLDLLCALLGTEHHCTLIKKCPNLEVLETRNVIGDRGLEVLGQYCKKLKRLRIERGEDEQGMEDEEGLVTQRGLIALSQGCQELEYVAVYVSDITNEALETIGTYLKNLCDFRLVLLDREEKITDLPLDNGVRSLLIGCKKLRRFAFYLRQGGLTDLGLSYIGQYSPNVRWMLLGYVGETDEGLMEFSRGCPNLQKLEMRGCCFSERAIAAAVMKLPSLRYLWVQGYRASMTGQDLRLMSRPYWNIELIPSRRVTEENQNGEVREMEHPAHILAYYSLAGQRTDCPPTVRVLREP